MKGNNYLLSEIQFFFIWKEIMRISALSGIQEFRPSPDR